MTEDKWADLMANLMKIAEELFSSVKNFNKGKLVAEVEAEVNVRIEIARDKDGRVNATLGILPIKSEELKGEVKEFREQRYSEGEGNKEIEVLDVDEEL